MHKNLRTVAVVLVAVLAAFAVSASGEEDTASSSESSGSESKSSNGVSKGLGSQHASADVTNVQITSEGEDPFVIWYASATITNNSEKRSDYFVTVAVESADGATKHADTIISVMNLEPGQTAQEKGMLTVDDIPEGSVASVKEVQRTASH